MPETTEIQVPQNESTTNVDQSRLLSVKEQIGAAAVAHEMWGNEQEFQTTVGIEKQHTLSLLGALSRGEVTEEVVANTISARMAENRAAANIDYLTDLYNRAGGSKRTREVLALGRRTGIPTSAIMIDMDNFKETNDQLGHLAGDSALIASADHIKTTIRESDVPIRWGGDEFLIVLPNTNLQNAANVGLKLGSDAPDTINFAMEDQDYVLPKPITFSIGLAEKIQDQNDRSDMETVEKELTDQADKAAKVAKFLGKNKVISAKKIGSALVHTDLSTNISYTTVEDDKGKIVKLNTFENNG